jgi:hypothetical protein
MAENEVHPFTSAKADGGDATLVRPSNWNANHKRGQKMTNTSGSTKNQNDLVQLDATADDSSTGIATAGALILPWVVTDATIANAAQGQHFSQGDVTIKVQGNVTRGNYLRTSATAQAAEDTGVAVGSIPPVGAIGVAKTGFVGGAGTVLAYMFGFSVAYDGGSYQSMGLQAINNAGAPNTKMDLGPADLVVFRRPNGGTYTLKSVSAVTNDTGLDNTNPNGRDQASVFGVSSWVHFYLVLAFTGVGAPVVRSRSSVTAPPTGPTLATGEVAWAYVGAIRFDGSSHLISTIIRGSKAYYTTAQNALNDGRATTETAVDLSALIPPNANVFTTLTVVLFNALVQRPLHIRVVTTQDYLKPTEANGGFYTFTWEAPNVGQQFLYLWDADPGASNGLIVDVTGYTIPNGGG